MIATPSYPALQWDRVLTQFNHIFALFAAFFALQFALSSPTRAQTTFTSVPLDCGGWFSGFAQADDGTLYGFGDVFGAWRSDPVPGQPAQLGMKWEYLNWSITENAIVGMAIAVQRDNSDVVYYATSNSLFKSTDRGATWTKLLGDLATRNVPGGRVRGSSPLLIRANDPNEIWYAGPRTGLTGTLWRSQDGGVSWSKMGGTAFDSNASTLARTLHNIPAFPNQIWVGATDGLHVSVNGGTTFTKVGSLALADVGMISRYPTTVSGATAGTGLVARANFNGGGISRITYTNVNDVSTYTVTHSGTVAIYFQYPTGLQIFSNGTASAWNTQADRHGVSLPSDGGQVFSLRGTSLKTANVPIWTDAATMAAKGHPDYGTDQVIECKLNPNRWYITGGGAPMYSEDAGLSWQYFPNGSGIAAVKTYRGNVSRHNSDITYFPASDIGGVIITDGGASGTAQYTPHRSYKTLMSGFSILEGPNTTNLVYPGLDQGIDQTILLKSNNSGATWTTTNLAGSGLDPSRDGIIKAVMSLNDVNDFLVVLASGTGKEGPITPGTINPGVWRTTNGGTTFTKVQDLPHASLNTGHRYDGQVCFIERDATLPDVRYFMSREQPLYKSTNGGTNWFAVAHPFARTDAPGQAWWAWSFMADPVRSNELWAAGDFAGVKRSTNGGTSWTSTPEYINARWVSANNGRVAVWGKKPGDSLERIYYSTDSGQTFTALTDSSRNFFGVQGLTVDNIGRIWVSWNSLTVITPPGIGEAPPTVTSDPANLSVVAGNSASFSAAAQGVPSPTYQWQRAIGAGSFTDLTNAAPYSGVTTTTLTIAPTTLSMNGDRFRLVATNSEGSDTSAPATLTVTAPPPPPVVQASQNVSGNFGVALSYQILANNNPASYALASGSLPSGVTLNTTTGLISGTPTAFGSFNPAFTATNGSGTSPAVTIPITIAAPPAPVVAASQSITITLGQSVNYQILASNSPASYALAAGSLPAGLSLNTTSGVLSGTPSAAFSGSPTFTATNLGGTSPAVAITITVNLPPAPVVSASQTITGNATLPVSYQIIASNSPTSYALASGSLPSGLSLNTSTGMISGTPTTTSSVSPTFTATNPGGTSPAVAISITIAAAPTSIVHEPFAYTAGTNALANQNGGTGWTAAWSADTNDISTPGLAYTSGAQSLVSSGARAVVKTNISSHRNLPATYSSGTYWLAALMDTNTISQEGGIYLLQDTNQRFFIGRRSNGPPWVIRSQINFAVGESSISSNALALVVVKFVLQAGNDQAFLWINPTLGSTPSDASAVALTDIGDLSFNRIQLSNGSFNDSIEVDEIRFGATFASVAPTPTPLPPVINSATTASGLLGSPFSYTITATNSPTSYSASGLPAGLTLNTSSGIISGTPSATGTSSVELGATNSVGTGTATLTLTISAPAAPVVTAGQSITGTVSAALSYQIAASNSPTSYALASGSLPAGLTLNTTTGTISGTPSSTFSGSPTFTATNLGGTSAAVALPITITAAPSAIYEPFAYTAGTGALAAKNGGAGWFSAWDNGANDLVASGFTYGSGGTLVTGGGRASIKNNIANYRTLRSSAYPNGTYWISFLARHSAVPANTWGGLSLYNGASETLFIGQRFGQNVWGLERAGGIGGVNSSGSVTTTTFLVAKIVLQPGNDQVRLFINPSLAATPADSSGLLFDNITDFTFDRVRLMHGLGSGQTLEVDEIRFGTSYANVAPVLPSAPVITSSLTQSGQVGVALSYTITASNTPTSFAASGLPTGLTLNTSTGEISGTPTSPGTVNASISATNAGGTDTETLVFTIALAPTGLEDFRSAQGLALDGSEDLLTPAGDGVANLLKYAFNMLGSGTAQAPDLDTPNSALLTPTGSAGLPFVSTESGTGKLQLTYIRRKASSNPSTGITYTVQFSDSLASGSWSPNASATEQVTSLDSTFERVVVTDSLTSPARRFARVHVVILP
jgi:hypothetical protein